MKSIIIVDDDLAFLEKISNDLEANFDIDTYNSPKELLENISRETLTKTSAIIVDFSMPDIDGITFIRNIREKFINVPTILVLTQYNNEENRITAYSNEIADLMSKNCSIQEITTRIENAINLHGKSTMSKLMISSDFYYDPTTMSFLEKDQALDLTKIETRILYASLIQLSLPVQKSQIIAKVWNNKIVTDQTLRTHLFNLNAKIKKLNIRFSIGDDKNIHLVAP